MRCPGRQRGFSHHLVFRRTAATPHLPLDKGQHVGCVPASVCWKSARRGVGVRKTSGGVATWLPTGGTRTYVVGLTYGRYEDTHKPRGGPRGRLVYSA
eukprot:1345658-Prymnesium_polylepis.1